MPLTNLPKVALFDNTAKTQSMILSLIASYRL